MICFSDNFTRHGVPEISLVGQESEMRDSNFVNIQRRNNIVLDMTTVNIKQLQNSALQVFRFHLTTSGASVNNYVHFGGAKFVVERLQVFLYASEVTKNVASCSFKKASTSSF